MLERQNPETLIKLMLDYVPSNPLLGCVFYSDCSYEVLCSNARICRAECTCFILAPVKHNLCSAPTSNGATDASLGVDSTLSLTLANACD